MKVIFKKLNRLYQINDILNARIGSWTRSKAIGEATGICTMYVWKYMHNLRMLGAPVRSCGNNGICYTRPFDLNIDRAMVKSTVAKWKIKEERARIMKGRRKARSLGSCIQQITP